ncbi:unnamed protein product [Paramecium primaurelia]|uniref:Uncharacterized protein n=1 Tax=Paramecium primaurelia TaxID=5886 RepID=A0A8S1M0U1_PARPR|nr:unnamed protein product [Paramecium primaurelia]
MQNIKLQFNNQSSFNRIYDYLDQIALAPYPSVPQKCVKNIPAFPQIILNSIQPLVYEVNKEVKPIFNRSIQNLYYRIKQNNNYQLNLKPFTFKLIQNHSIRQSEKYRTITVNKDNSILIAACDEYIKKFEFKQDQLRRTKILSEHKDSVTTLNFMNKSNQFISESLDKQIIIWSTNHNNQWISSQKLRGHTDFIFCIVLNKNEDLIILGSCDKTIKSWYKQQQWLCSQTIIDHTYRVYGLILNEEEQIVILWI